MPGAPRAFGPGKMMRRRDFLSLITLGAGAGACVSSAPARPAKPRLVVPPVRVDAGREIRTVVGLRPFRP